MAITVGILVQPRAPRAKIAPMQDGRLVIRRAAALALALALSACGGTTGTVQVSLLTAPDSHLLDAVQHIRLTLTDPHQVVEADRTATGFDLALELDATNANAALIVEGLDATGALIACGQSPPFPVGAINAQIAIYVAAPMSIAVDAVALGAPRSQVAGIAIASGAVLAGGLEVSGGGTGTGTAATSIAAYNAYDHTLIEGIPLPAARAAMAIGTDGNGGVYLLGGTGGDGAATGTLWKFDTTVAPSGSFATLTDQASFARSGALLVQVAADHFLVTGAPVLELTAGVLTARSDIASLPPAGAEAAPTGSTPTAVFADTALVRFRGTAFDTLPGGGRSDATAVTLPDGRVAVLGGASQDALVIDGATGAVSTAAAALSTPRIQPAVAATARHVVVAGGSDASHAPIASADILDATTLMRLATVPILARTGGFAVALNNDQVLLGGGAPAAAALELFTPGPPP